MSPDGTTQPMWLDPSWLSWGNNEITWQPLDKQKAKRPYEIHEHACNILTHSTNELDRVDVITTLKRVVSQRVRVLKEAYGLGQLQIPDKPKRDFELLAYVGIVRPLMLRRLVEIRNIVEHDDSNPPTRDECEVFADFVWYFLRSTDALAYHIFEEFGLLPPELKHGRRRGDPEVRINYVNPPDGPQLLIQADLGPTCFSHGSVSDWIEIRDATIEPDPYGSGLTLIRGSLVSGRSIWAWYFGRPFLGPS